MSEELKNCPFCGSQAEYVEDNDHHGSFFFLGCSKSGCPANLAIYGEPIENKQVCIDRWNTRCEHSSFLEGKTNENK